MPNQQPNDWVDDITNVNDWEDERLPSFNIKSRANIPQDEKSLLQKWDELPINQSYSGGIFAKGLNKIAEPMMEWGDNNPRTPYANAARYGGAWLSNVGQGIDAMFTPLNFATFGAGGLAVKGGRTAVELAKAGKTVEAAKKLRTADKFLKTEKVLSAPQIVSGGARIQRGIEGGEDLEGTDWTDIGTGMVEGIGGMFGIRGRLPQIAEASTPVPIPSKPVSSGTPTEFQLGLPMEQPLPYVKPPNTKQPQLPFGEGSIYPAPPRENGRFAPKPTPNDAPTEKPPFVEKRSWSQLEIEDLRRQGYEPGGLGPGGYPQMILKSTPQSVDEFVPSGRPSTPDDIVTFHEDDVVTVPKNQANNAGFITNLKRQGLELIGTDKDGNGLFQRIMNSGEEGITTNDPDAFARATANANRMHGQTPESIAAEERLRNDSPEYYEPGQIPTEPDVPIRGIPPHYDWDGPNWETRRREIDTREIQNASYNELEDIAYNYDFTVRHGEAIGLGDPVYAREMLDIVNARRAELNNNPNLESNPYETPALQSNREFDDLSPSEQDAIVRANHEIELGGGREPGLPGIEEDLNALQFSNNNLQIDPNYQPSINARFGPIKPQAEELSQRSFRFNSVADNKKIKFSGKDADLVEDIDLPKGDLLGNLGQSYATQILSRIPVDETKKGLQIEKAPWGSGVDLTYYAPDGTPIAHASATDHGVGTLVADKTRGLLYGRAVLSIGKELMSRGIVKPSGLYSNDTKNLIQKMKELIEDESGSLDLTRISQLADSLMERFRSFIADETGAVEFDTGKYGDRNAEPGGMREALNLSRGATTTMDLSAAMRQGMPLIFTKAWRDAWIPMVKSLGDEGAFQKTLADLKNRPMFQSRLDLNTGKVIKSQAEQFGVRLMDLDTRLGRREESIASNWVENGKFLGENAVQRGYQKTVGRYARASNRAYTAFLNQLRADTLENLVTNAKSLHDSDVKIGLKNPTKNPYTDLTFGKEIGDFVNTATGRGPIKTAVPWKTNGKWGLQEKGTNNPAIIQALTDVLFSPRLMASRVRMLNPMTYMMASPFVRKEYTKSLLSVGAAWGGMAGLATMMGADVSTDTNSADFGKIKIDNTRIDPAAGFQQYLVATSRLFSALKTSSASGQVSELGQGFQAETRRDINDRFLTNKLHPVFKFANDILDASKRQPFGVLDRTAQMFIPLLVQDVVELARENPKLLPLIAPVALGMGTQTYSNDDLDDGKIVPKEYDWNFTGGRLPGMDYIFDYEQQQ